MSATADLIFSGDEWLRYSRHIQLSGFGASAQMRLKQSHIVVVGAGGLGSPALLYLAAAGVGHISIFDGDHVEVSNLQRQVIFTTSDLGRPKMQAAAERLNALNPHLKIDGFTENFCADNGSAILESADILLDCTDNFTARYLINDLCAESGTPWLFASIDKFDGQCALFVPGQACFRCLFPVAPNDALNCSEAGVLGVLPGFLGTMQASEAIKYLAGLQTPLKNHLLTYNALDYSNRKFRLTKDSNCPTCTGQSRQQQEVRERVCAIKDDEIELSVAQLKADPDKYHWLDVRCNEERQAFHIGGEHQPLDQIEQYPGNQKTAKPIVCYCQSGARSRKAAEQLRKKGWEAYSLNAGLVGWLEN